MIELFGVRAVCGQALGIEDGLQSSAIPLHYVSVFVDPAKFGFGVEVLAGLVCKKDQCSHPYLVSTTLPALATEIFEL